MLGRDGARGGPWGLKPQMFSGKAQNVFNTMPCLNQLGVVHIWRLLHTQLHYFICRRAAGAHACGASRSFLQEDLNIPLSFGRLSWSLSNGRCHHSPSSWKNIENDSPRIVDTKSILTCGCLWAKHYSHQCHMCLHRCLLLSVI